MPAASPPAAGPNVSHDLFFFSENCTEKRGKRTDWLIITIEYGKGRNHMHIMLFIGLDFLFFP